MTKVNFGNIPTSLKNFCSFCLWKKEKRNGTSTKVPYSPSTLEMARTNKSSDFSDYNTTMRQFVSSKQWDGIGFRVAEGIGAVDIDHCIRPDGSLNDIATSVLALLRGVYFERSPSGTGLRGFFKLPDNFAYDKTRYLVNNRSLGLEVYLPGVTNRFVTVTGDVFRAGGVELESDALRRVLDTFMLRKTVAKENEMEHMSYLSDEQVIAHASSTGNQEYNEKFKDLMAGHWEERYDSQSEADLALASILNYWCGNVEEQVDRIFRSSGLMREKWDRATNGSTYGRITIKNAASPTVYVPVQRITAEQDFVAVNTSLEELKPESNPRYGFKDIGLGLLFNDYFKDIALYVKKRRAWYVYNGEVWEHDDEGLIVAELANQLAKALCWYAWQIEDEDTRIRFLKRVTPLQTQKGRDTMLKYAKSVAPVSVSAFDQNLYLFNCKNGTLDLKQMKFRPHSSKDMLTKMSPVVYDPNIVCTRWEKFIDEVMMGDKELAKFLQKAIGYALTGDTSQECAFILYGPTTRNGKTTTIDIISKVMGDYARAANPESLAVAMKKSNAGPTEDIARLVGARFVGISEMEKTFNLKSSIIKQLTGNGTITARYLNENSFEFKMVGKMFIDTNYLPKVSDETLFESGRLKLIPFRRHFAAEEQDTSLKTTLSQPDMLSGILNWCIQGYQMFKSEGLGLPRQAQEATEEYVLLSNIIEQFFSECLVSTKGKELLPKAVYGRYRDWCVDNGYSYEGTKRFYERLKMKFEVQKRRPWDGSKNPTIMVNDVTWATDDLV